MESTFEMDDTDPAMLAAETLGLDLLNALVDELKVAPDCWQKMSQLQQDQTTDRLRARTQTLVEQALSMLFSGNYPACSADLVNLGVKGDSIKCSLLFSKTPHNLHELADAVGRQVVVVIATHENYTHRMSDLHAKQAQGDLFKRGENVEAYSEGLEGSAIVDLQTGEITSRLEKPECATTTLPDLPQATGSH